MLQIALLALAVMFHGSVLSSANFITVDWCLKGVDSLNLFLYLFLTRIKWMRNSNLCTTEAIYSSHSGQHNFPKVSKGHSCAMTLPYIPLLAYHLLTYLTYTARILHEPICVAFCKSCTYFKKPIHTFHSEQCNFLKVSKDHSNAVNFPILLAMMFHMPVDLFLSILHIYLFWEQIYSKLFWLNKFLKVSKCQIVQWIPPILHHHDVSLDYFWYILIDI